MDLKWILNKFHLIKMPIDKRMERSHGMNGMGDGYHYSLLSKKLLLKYAYRTNLNLPSGAISSCVYMQNM